MRIFPMKTKQFMKVYLRWKNKVKAEYYIREHQDNEAIRNLPLRIREAWLIYLCMDGNPEGYRKHK